MWISSFYLDGFGIYHQQGVQDISPGLVVFLGENESGKTTLMQFVRWVLFGFPRRGPRTNLYPPFKGGKHGGRLILVRQDGRRFTIERVDRHATMAEEGRAPEKAEPAARLLGGLDRATFERVFAIGLDELKGLEVLSQEGVSGRLFSASAGLGAASVPGAIQILDKEMGALLSQRGQQQRLNQLRQQLTEVDQQIQVLRGQAADYAAGQRRREQLEEQIGQNRNEEEQIRQKLAWLEHLEKARQPWINRGLAQEKAQAREFARDFPANGLERFENLKKELERLRQEHKNRQEEAGRLEQQLGRLSVDETLIAHQEAIAALLAEKEKLATALGDYPTVKSSRNQAEEEFHRRLGDLGTDWDENKLAQVDTSVQVRQRVQEFSRQLEGVERQYEQAQAHQRTLQEAGQEAKLNTDQAQRQWQELATPPILDDRQLQQQQDAVRQLRAALHQRDLLAAQLQARLANQQELAARLPSIKGQMEFKGAILPWWLGLVVLAAGIGAGAILVWQRAYVPGGLAALTGLGAAALLFLFRHWQRQAETGRLAQLQEYQQQGELNLNILLEEISHLEDRLGEGDREIERVAQGAGIQPPHDLAQLELKAAALEDAAGQLREWQAREREAAKAEGEWRAVQEKSAKAGRQTEETSQELARLAKEWQAWLAARGFSAQIRPPGFELVLKAVEHARSAQTSLEEFRRRVGLMEDYLTEVRRRIGQVLAACRRKPLGEAEGVQDLEALRLALQASLETGQQQRDLAGKLAAAQAEVARLEGEKNAQQLELEALLQKAGAREEEEFRRVAAAYEEWRAAIQEVEANERTLRTLAGTSAAQAALEKELSRIDPRWLQAEKERLTARGHEVKAAISQDDQDIGSLNRLLADLARDEKLGELLLRQRSLKEQLADATRRWAALAVCRHLLEQARGVYELERQPLVIKEADRYLQVMAQKRYKLVSSVGEDSIHLEDTSLRRKEEISWSAGLADQVYLAIRLGLAREFGRHTEPLPVILDDVLVRFDPQRRRGAARVILEFSQEQQVLMFSCHPEFKEIIAEVRQDPQYHRTPVTYYTIADGVIRKG